MNLPGERAVNIVSGLMLLGVLASCGTTPDPIPLRGPRPRSVLVVPSRPIADLRSPKLLDAAFARVLDQRGFRVPPVAEAVRLLSSHGWQVAGSGVGELPLEALLTDRGLEAVWITEVERWAFEATAGYPLVFLVRCSMVSTKTGSVLWTCQLQGEQRTARSQTVINPLADPDPFESDHPFFWERVNEVLGDEDLFDLVARSFGLRLP